MRFDGKVAVVTGGSSGIGLATAQRFVAEGGYVFITGRRQSELDKAVATIRHQVTAVQGDLADLDDLDRLIATVRSEKGGLDVIVSSAGFIEPVSLEHVTPEHFDKTFAVNARGTFFIGSEGAGAAARRRVDRADLLDCAPERRAGLHRPTRPARPRCGRSPARGRRT